MLSHAEKLEAYQKYFNLFEKNNSWNKDLLSYKQYDICDGDNIGPRWATYYMQASDYVRELLNVINQYRLSIARVSSWNEILKSYSDIDKLDLLIEFVYPLALMCLDYPYKIKNKIIYSAYCISDECRFLTTNPPVSLLPIDKHINYKDLESIASKWGNFEGLKNNLGLLNGRLFQQKTENFRNAEHHGIPSGIEMGYTRTIRRLPSEKGSRRYGFGGSPPLSLGVLVDLSEVEHQHGVEAFKSFWLLLDEQVKFLKAT